MVFDLVQDAGGDLAAGTDASDSLDVAFLEDVDLLEFSDGGDDDMYLAACFWQVPSFNDFHAQFVVKIVVLLKQGNQVLLNGINSTVIRIISHPSKLDVKRVLSKHRNQDQVLKVIRNTSFFAAVKRHLNTLITDNQTGVKLEQLTALGDDDLATIGDLFDHVQET